MNLDWAPTIAAVLGSTGLIGLITALITRTRVSRLRRFVDEAKSVKETLPADSKSRAVLDQAIDHATLRLAAVELTRFGSSTRVAIAIWALILLPVLSFLLLISWVSAVGAVNGFAQGNNAAFTTSVTNFYLGIIYVVLGVFGAVFLVQWRREKIMRQAIIRLPVALLADVPLTIDPKPQRKVKAWVRFGTVPVRVDAVAARWTPDAVGVVFRVADVEHRCWVWSGAVEEV